MSATYNIPGNLDLTGGELQNAKMQLLNASPSTQTEGRIWFDSVNHIPMYSDGTSAKEFGRTYTFSTGLTENSGTVTVTDYDKLIKNVATGNSAIAINGTSSYNLGLAIMGNAAATYSIAIGNSSKTESSYAIAIGSSADAEGIAIGRSAVTINSSAIAIGHSAGATASNSIQIGTGTNSTTASLSVGFGSSYNYPLLDGTTGLIPSARIPDLSGTYLAATLKGANNGVAELDSSGKVPTSQLPAFVDDVIDSYIVSGATALSAGWLSATSGGSALTPETGKIYVVLSSGAYQNKTYRWSGTTYVEISASPGQATESAAGIAEIATQSEVNTGTDDTRFVTPKKLAAYVSSIKKFAEANPALTASGGSVTWEITNSLATADIASVRVYVVSTGETIFAPYKATSSTITIEMLASSNVASGTYRAVVMG